MLLTFNKLPFVIKNFVLSIFEWPLKTGFTVSYLWLCFVICSTLCMLGNFSCFCFLLIFLSKINIFQKIFQEHYQRVKQFGSRPGTEVIKLFPCTTFTLLINVKMPTIICILTFISMINTSSERLKVRNFFICRYISFMSS